MVDLYFYRDPEAEEQKGVEEADKIPGAEEATVEAGAFSTGGGGVTDWDAPNTAGTFVPPEATGTGTSWDAEATGGEWAADTTAAEIPAATSGW